MIEENSVRREALKEVKVEKKQWRELYKKQCEEEKIKEQESKKIRADKHARKKAFEDAWAPTAVSTYGEELHDQIHSRKYVPPNTFRAPFLRFSPSICKNS